MRSIIQRPPLNPGVSLVTQDRMRLSVTRSGKSYLGPPHLFPGGFWLSDLPPADALRLTHGKRDRIVHSDGWIGATWRQIRQDFGLTGQPTSGEIQLLAEISARVIRLTAYALNEFKSANGSGISRTESKLFSSASLAKGIGDIVWPVLRNSVPINSWLVQSSRHMHLFGMRMDTAFDRHQYVFTLRYPPLTYLRQLARNPVPGHGPWNEIELPEAVTELNDSLQRRLLKLQRPVILRGMFQAHDLVSAAWVQSWLRGTDSSWGRSWFTLPELVGLRRAGTFFAAEAYAGPRRRQSLEKNLFARLARGLEQACRGRQGAACSWSANLTAENLTRAACSKSRRHSRPTSMEAVWNAASDRIACLQAIAAIEAAGGDVRAAVAGTVTVGVNGECTDAAAVVDSVWQCGMHLSAGAARQLKLQGARLLTQADLYGGAQEDLLLAVASQLGLCGLVRRMDLIADKKHGRQSQIESLSAALSRLSS